MRRMWKSMVLVVVAALALALAGCGAQPAADEGTDEDAGGGLQSPGTSSNSGAQDGRDDPVAQPVDVPPGAVRFVQAVDPTTAWILTDRQVLRTADGGGRWLDVTPAGLSGTLLAAAFLDAGTGWVATVGDTGEGALTVWRTADGGRSWQSAQVEVPDAGQGPAGGGHLVFTDESHGWLLVSHGVAAGSNWVTVYVSGDGGASWQLATSTDPRQQEPGRLPLGGLKSGIGALDGRTAWVTGLDYGDELYLYRTRDAGQTWERQALAVPAGYDAAGGAGETRPPVFFEDGGFLPVLFHQEEQAVIFYATDDGGETWQATAPVTSSVGSLAWSVVDARHIVVTDGSTIYVSDDGARSWKSLAPDQELADVSQLSFASPEVGWALASGTLWKTEDGGRTWQAVGK